MFRRPIANDAPLAAPLILEATPSLEIVLGSRGTALRAAEAAFRGGRTFFGHRYGLIAEEAGKVAGLVIAVPGRLEGALRLGTAVVLARGAGVRHAADLARRGRVLDRLLPPLGRDHLYVSALAVAPGLRRQGIGSALIRRVIGAAAHLGLLVALDVAGDNEQAIRLYREFGFTVIEERRTTPEQRRLVPVERSLRMELRPPGERSGQPEQA